jgi:hypothetical protein
MQLIAGRIGREYNAQMIRWAKKNKLFSEETSMPIDRPANDPSFPISSDPARIYFERTVLTTIVKKEDICLHRPGQKAARSKLERMTHNMHLPMPAESMSGAVS